MSIRPATVADTSAILDIGAAAYRNTDYVQIADACPDAAADLISTMRETGVLMVEDRAGEIVGIVGMIIAPYFLNRAYRTAHQLIWWVEPSMRGRGIGRTLLSASELACRYIGVAAINNITHANSPAAATALYADMGYPNTETSFSKVTRYGHH